MAAALQPVVVIGGGGHGREVLHVLRAVNAVHPTFDVLGVLDADPTVATLLSRLGVPLLGPPEVLGDLHAYYLVGIGDGALRHTMDLMATTMRCEPATAVHPAATVGDDVELGPGTVIAAGARVTTHVRFGRHVHVNTNATVAHDCVLGSYVTVSPGANISGNVTLDEGVYVGTNAAVIQGLHVAAWSTVGAGALVHRDVAPGITVVGVPAGPVRTR